MPPPTDCPSMLGQKNILKHVRQHVRLHRGNTKAQVLEKAAGERQKGIVEMYFGHLVSKRNFDGPRPKLKKRGSVMDLLKSTGWTHQL